MRIIAVMKNHYVELQIWFFTKYFFSSMLQDIFVRVLVEWLSQWKIFMVNNTNTSTNKTSCSLLSMTVLSSLVTETNFVTRKFFFQLQHHSGIPKTCHQWQKCSEVCSFLNCSNQSGQILTLLTFWLSHAQIFNKDLENQFIIHVQHHRHHYNQ